MARPLRSISLIGGTYALLISFHSKNGHSQLGFGQSRTSRNSLFYPSFNRSHSKSSDAFE
ncbi:hypothetical protein BS630_00160 [Rhizobium laguerreae]|nr:hypothetical protein BS630_00160 [Rhizobium laguerreae]